MENLLKVQAKIEELNNSSQPINMGGRLFRSNWIAIQGSCAVVNSTLLPNLGASYNLSKGIPLKVFRNNTDGEIKLFWANFFEN